MSSDQKISSDTRCSTGVLSYSTDATGGGPVTILRHPDGVEVIVRKPGAHFATELGAGILIAGFLLIVGLIPRGSHVILGIPVSSQLPLWVRLIVLAIALRIVMQMRRSWREAFRAACIDCRKGKLYFTWPHGRGSKTYQIDWDRIHDLHAGKTEGDDVEYYIGVIDAAKEEQELLTGWLTRSNALHVACILRRAIGLPPNRQDAQDFDDDCRRSDRT